MKNFPSPATGSRARRAFSLIEMIGVLALIAIAATMLVPVFVKQTDMAVATQESATLQSFTTAFQNNIERNQAIPSITNWVTVVATELGLTSNSVALTPRNQTRVLLIDTNGFGALSLPYTQRTSGTPNPITNSTLPRFMVVSSLGLALPALTGTNGPANTTNFNALWNAPNGTVPTNSGSPWIGWKGQASDVNVQRLDLSLLFAHLVLSNSDPTNAPYSIGGSSPINLPAQTNINAYYLLTTPFNLYLANTNLEAAQVLLRDSSWVFSSGGWRRVPSPAPSLTISGTNLVTTTVTVISSNIDDCCHQFNCQSFCTNVCSPKNTYCTTAKCCSDMTNYMSCYQQYAASGFTSSSCRNNLQNCYNTLNNDCGNLCSH